MTGASEIWTRWCHTQKVIEHGVPLFQCSDETHVETRAVGKAGARWIVQRHRLMEEMILAQTEILVTDWKQSQHRYDGMIYLMFRKEVGSTVIPLYIGKAETFGKGNANLSANLRQS